MDTVPIRYAGVAAAALFGAAVIGGPALDLPAAADPASPTFESLAPPPPPPPPRRAPAPAPAPTPVAVPNTSGDEAAIRGVIAASTDAYNGENWDAFMGMICSGKRPTFPVEMIKRQRGERGPMQVTVNSVSVNGDRATAQTTMSDRTTVNIPYHMVREGDWKVCG